LALEDFNEAIKLKPLNADYYKGRAKVYRELAQFELAEVDERKSKELEN
jgi:Flp pilus assembly protein TadD